MTRTAIILSMIVISLLGFSIVGTASADCADPNDGTIDGSADTIVCATDDPNGVDGGGGNDTITVNNNVEVTGDVAGGKNNDQITNDGTVNGDVVGGGGGIDIIENNGTVNGDILGGGGVDFIENTGTVTGDIVGGDGYDQIENDGTVTNITDGDGISRIYNRGTVTNGITITSNTNNSNVSNSGSTGFIETGGGSDRIVNTTGGTVSGDINAGGGNDRILNNLEGSVDGDINAEGGNDNVTIYAIGSVGGTIDGGTTNETTGDRLEFAGDAVVSSAQKAAFDNLVNTNASSGTVVLNGKAFTWVNFEMINSTVIFTIVDPVTGETGTATVSLQDAPNLTQPNEVQCQNVKVFKGADGFAQIYSGFDQGYAEGFLVAVFNVSEAVAGNTFDLSDDNTPAWSVQTLSNNTFNVLSEGGQVMGTCDY